MAKSFPEAKYNKLEKGCKHVSLKYQTSDFLLLTFGSFLKLSHIKQANEVLKQTR